MRASTTLFCGLWTIVSASSGAFAATGTTISCPASLPPDYHAGPGTKQRGFVPSDGAALGKASVIEARPDDPNPMGFDQNPDNEKQSGGFSTIFYSQETSETDPRSIACYYGGPDPAYPVILLMALPDDREIECRYRYAIDPRQRAKAPPTMRCTARPLADATKR
jgi:hypothetical protein